MRPGFEYMRGRLLLFNKPFGVISQFSPSGIKPTLKNWITDSDVYPAGRLDTDSEGLLLLTDDSSLQNRISHPRYKLPKKYWAEVEGLPGDEELSWFERGLDLGDFISKPAKVRKIPVPGNLWPRVPPIRVRKEIPTCWLEVILGEGKNRQVRRMTAKIGFPTLRLIRAAVGPWTLESMAPGKLRTISAEAASKEIDFYFAKADSSQ
jgi:23S rRNA pseudouridine2457 synthase